MFLLLYIKIIFLSYLKNLLPFFIKIAILLLGRTNKLSNHDSRGERGARKMLQTRCGQSAFFLGKNALLSAVLLWACHRDSQNEGPLCLLPNGTCWGLGAPCGKGVQLYSQERA